MDPLTIALIVVASIVGYGFCAGVTRALAHRAVHDEALAFWSGLLWPLVLPLIAGVAVVHRLTASKRAALPEARTRG